MIRRISMVVMALTFVAVTLLIIYFSTNRDITQKISGELLTVVLVALQILSIVFILIVLYGYLRTRRSLCLLFEGVKNEEKLTSAENSPIDLNTLAKEELIRQFVIIYYELQSFIQQAEKQRRFESDRSQEEYTDKTTGTSAFLSDKLNFEEAPDPQNLTRFFPSLHRGSHDPHDLTITMIYFLQQNLEQVLGAIHAPFQESGDKRTSDNALMSRHSQISSIALREIMSPTPAKALQEIVNSVPAEVKPVVGLINLLIPPRLTKAAAYLQLRGNPRSPRGDAGITVDVSSPDGSTDSMVRTFWQPLQADDDHASSRRFPQSAERQLTHVYVDLLKPAMRLLVLLFWERKLISALHKRKPKKGEPNRQEYNASFIFLLGALYAISGLQFKQQQTFFVQLAIERFRAAADLHADWETPHRYIGNIYDILANRHKDNANQCTNFIRAGVDAYDTYRDLAGKQADRERKQADADLQKARLLLHSPKDEDLDHSVYLFHQALQQVGNPLTYENHPQQNDAYFYDVACWCGRVEGKDMRARKHIEHTFHACNGFEHWTLPQVARLYLVYSMARSHFLWFAVEDDDDLRYIIDKQEAERLKGELTRIEYGEATFSSHNKLVYQKGEKFQDRIEEIVKKVWPR